MSERVTRSQTGKTPRKPMNPGFVETPGRRRSTRKSTFQSEDSATPEPSSRLSESTEDLSYKAEINGFAKENGHINGFVKENGHSSALANGNGHINGFANGNGHVNGFANGNGHVNGSANGNGHINGFANGNGHINGFAKENGFAKGNGHTNGYAKANGHVNGSPASHNPTLADPKVDTSGHFEFGGSFGVGAMMIGFPILMWYMWIGATYYDGRFPTRAPGESYGEFLEHLANLVYTGAYPHAKAWAIYWTFFIFEGLCYLFMPGVYGHGKPLEHLGGKQLPYYCSAVSSFYLTIFMAVALHLTGLFKLYTLIDEFGPIMSVAIISGFLVAIVAYVSALARGAEHRMTGYPVYDFFMGAELNPRMFKWLDFKMFFEVRLPWYILFLLSLGTAARQIERYGYVSGEVGFVLMAHFLYANACSKGEELIVTTWDMYYEKWGFMLIFWNLAGVPLSYCHCTIYLANHHPSEYRWNPLVLTALYAAYLFVYWVWDTANSQKNFFRAEEKGKEVFRKSFPQLPYRRVKNPKVIETGQSDRILCDGWYGKARKIHYACDFFFASTWGLITGFNSPFPWFYSIFFTCMIIHRAYRDIQRCQKKYGDAWVEYTARVPYLFIPGLF